MNYCNIGENKEHIITLIKWLIEEVQSAGGDGDGLWYSKYFSVNSIKGLIETEKLLPKYWKMEEKEGPSILLGENQEWLIITNDRNDYKNSPDWQQVTLVY